MRPPPLALLQWSNLLVGCGSFLTAMVSNGLWTSVGWSFWSIGLAMTIGSLCYAGCVIIGGRLADHWGRARTALLGAAIGALGCALAVAAPGPSVALVATMLAFAGPALFFPGCAGLFSDAEGASGAAPVPLHVKVSKYNLGWSAGNFCGFAGFALLAQADVRIGFAVAGAAFLAVIALLWHWRSLPPRPPAPAGDRAPHPALPRLTMTARVALLLCCMLSMGMISAISRALAGTAGDDARGWAGLTLACYSGGYVITFMVFGHWAGWVLRPWRMWTLQIAFLVGALGICALALGAMVTPTLLAACGALIGVGFASCYTTSIYYSLRLPDGVGRAAGLHETFIGVGNTLGPLVSGLALSGWSMWAVGSDLLGLGCYLVAAAVICLGVQAVLIPAAVRLGAR
ncbi:MAG: MFS transporter [Planctomycetes bacterium]|nr:MFS transporter [Planctomycetota bacterium]